MTWLVLIAFFACIAAGAYLALARDLLRIVVGLALIGAGVNLALFASGRLSLLEPAIIAEGARSLPPLISQAANPLPQALVLTAIVIGFALLCFALVLVLRLIEAQASDDSLSLQTVEPPASDPVKPPLPPEERP